ncbi:hypothetical protein, partial [Aquipuribacter sp. MA13-6]
GTDPAAGRGRRWVLLVVGVVVGVQLGLLAGFLLPSSDEAEPTGPGVVGADGTPLDPDDPLAERVAELQAEEAARDAEAVVVLTEQTEDVLDVLSPVVVAAGEHAPGSPPPAAETVEEWRSAVTLAQETFGDAPSGGTDVNVARAALVASLGNLETMVGAYDLVADAVPADGAGLVDVDGALEVAASARRSAALAWSVGATQLDAVNVAADRGHVHLYLPPVPDSGALTADPEPVSP